MKQLEEYRSMLLERLGQAVDEFRASCLAVSHPDEPLEPGGWTVHQVAVHTRDVDHLVYGARARRTLTEDRPVFPNFDGDAYMREHYDPAEPLDKILDELAQSVHALLKLLHDMPVESWSRESTHETLGSGITLQMWVERGLEHLAEHVAAVSQAKSA